jgi:hypothetical protein
MSGSRGKREGSRRNAGNEKWKKGNMKETKSKIQNSETGELAKRRLSDESRIKK